MWPFKLISRSGRDRQHQQSCESLIRDAQNEVGDLAVAKAKNETAAKEAMQSDARRMNASAPLRKTLKKVIDLQRDGRFTPSNEPNRRP